MKKSYANVNTYVHKGQNVISAKAFNRKDANTDAQKAHRAGFKLMGDFWNSLGGYANGCFPGRLEKQSPYNYFMALNMPGAIDNTGEAPVIRYSELQISKGMLPRVTVNSAVINATGMELDCESRVDFPKAGADDVVTVLAKTKAGALYTLRQARGSEENMLLQVAMPEKAKADLECVYVFVTSADGKRVSNSVFVEVGME